MSPTPLFIDLIKFATFVGIVALGVFLGHRLDLGYFGYLGVFTALGSFYNYATEKK